MVDSGRRLPLRGSPLWRFVERSLPPKVESDVVWHYTDVGGALGIIENRVLWASSVVTLNDSDEILHGLRLIEDRAIEHNLPSIARTWLRDARAKLTDSKRADVFVLSASLDGKSQTQFALYGRYAVGLNSAMPMTKVPPPPGVLGVNAAFAFGWRRVLYAENDKRRHVDRLVESLGALAEGSEGELEDPDIYTAAIECITRAATYMKDQQFAHESEVRLVGRSEDTEAAVFFRTSRDVIIPYIKIQSDFESRSGQCLLPLTRFNLGYGLDFDLAKVGLEVALHHNGYELNPLPIENVAGSRR